MATSLKNPIAKSLYRSSRGLLWSGLWWLFLSIIMCPMAFPPFESDFREQHTIWTWLPPITWSGWFFGLAVLSSLFSRLLAGLSELVQIGDDIRARLDAPVAVVPQRN